MGRPAPSRARTPRVRAFAPILGARPRLLILGSLPGVASLRAGEYYAHPRNQFWPLMDALFGVSVELPYARRVAALRAAGVAVWDVLAEASRAGSADADIDVAGARAHDIRGLLLRHGTITVVAFNGGTARRLYTRLVLPMLPENRRRTLHHVVLPSTSPAHAALTGAAKLAHWRTSLCGPGTAATRR
ncbi:MAG: DNA-deoxyinosine glycosylase [Steroidobacteraceae bacterium]